LISLNVRKNLVGAEGPFELRVELKIPKTKLTVLYGVSGAGKTTLLRMLAGLEHPDEGSIVVDGETWFNATKKVCVPPQKRSVGLVFQNYALFPSMTVRRNLEYAAGSRRDPGVDTLLEMVELKELQQRYPDELSGGQQQRVALARALIRRPKILLLDEPLSALDQDMREKLQEQILRLHQMLNLTTILVSHDRSEIFRMADHVLTINNGRLTFEGSPFHVFQKNQSCSGHSRGTVLNIFSDKGHVGIIAAVDEGPMKVEIRLNERQLKQLSEKSSLSH
jgi:molybdate transport system ATP-binding protein